MDSIMDSESEISKLFNVKENEAVGFDSRWKVTKVSLESTTQTIYETVDMQTNTASPSAPIETQTDFVVVTAPQYNEDNLASFLRNVYPSIRRELDDTATSQALKNYNPIIRDVEVQARMFKSVQINGSSKDTIVPVSALSWNCTGYTIAVTGALEHQSWCHHTGFVSFYTIDRNDMVPELPQKTFYIENCITCLQFHPILPYVIAGGTFTGEIVLWNTQNTDSDNVIIARINGHEEALTQISWIYDIDAPKTLLLATSSLDGFLNLWNFSVTSGSLKIKVRYKIKAPIFGKMKRKTELPSDIARKVDRGIIAFDFSKFTPNMFAVAAEGGLVVLCSMIGPKILQTTDDAEIVDPVYKYFDCHEGEVLSINFSPNRKEMFMTNGSDGEIRAYLIEQDEPAQTIFMENALQCISWVPHHEKLVIGCSSKGTIEIFNIARGKRIEIISKESAVINVLTQMELNHKRATIVAIGTKTGSLQFWRMPWIIYSRKCDIF